MVGLVAVRHSYLGLDPEVCQSVVGRRPDSVLVSLETLGSVTFTE